MNLINFSRGGNNVSKLNMIKSKKMRGGGYKLSGGNKVSFTVIDLDFFNEKFPKNISIFLSNN